MLQHRAPIKKQQCFHQCNTGISNGYQFLKSIDIRISLKLIVQPEEFYKPENSAVVQKQ